MTGRGRVLTFNVGSSSLKVGLYDLATGKAEWTVAMEIRAGFVVPVDFLPPEWPDIREGLTPARLACLLVTRLMAEGQPPLRACAHRVVHGGDRDGAVWLDAAVLDELDCLSPLCPLHQPPALALIRAVAGAFPRLPQIAAFDTAFHAPQPLLWREYALPQALRESGLRRYGFHGLSCQSIVEQLGAQYPEEAGGRLVVAHLGNGSSLTAIRGGLSQATTMGFSALDGVPMGTRCGHLDPGVLLYLLQQGWSVAALENLLYRESGLLGLSGISGDVRTLLASPQAAAAFALEVLADRVAREVASLATVLGGLDVLVLTGGIGEHCPAVRNDILRRLAWMGARFNEGSQDTGSLVSTPASAFRIRVLPTDEQGQLFRAARMLLAEPAGDIPV